MSPLFAAGTEMPDFLPPLVGLVGGAAIVGYVMSSLRVVPIVGFLVAGVLIGPEQLGLRPGALGSILGTRWRPSHHSRASYS